MKPRPIPAATEYILRGADEMEEILYGVDETYIDMKELGAHPGQIARSVEHDAAMLARRSPGDRELAALGLA